MSYTIVLIIHLLGAIIFLGFVFADVIVLPAMKKVLNDEEHQNVMNSISNRARKIFPITVLILILSGGFMLSKYINSDCFHDFVWINMGYIYKLNRLHL